MNELTEVTPIPKTTHYVPCPWCGKQAGSIDHLINSGVDTMWYCDSCRERFRLVIKDKKTFTAKVPGEAMPYNLVLLRHGGIGLVVRGLEVKGGGNDEYFYNEHTCPTNYLPHVKMVIDLKTGDTDPHGIFRYVGKCPYDPRIEDCNLADETLAEIIGKEAFNKPAEITFDDTPV